MQYCDIIIISGDDAKARAELRATLEALHIPMVPSRYCVVMTIQAYSELPASLIAEFGLPAPEAPQGSVRVLLQQKNAVEVLRSSDPNSLPAY